MTKEILRYSRNTWHYKIMLWAWGFDKWSNEFKEHKLPRNLCPYLRKLVFTIPYSPFLYIWRKMPHVIREHKDGVIAIILITIGTHGCVFAISQHQDLPWWIGWFVLFIGTVFIGGGMVALIGIIKAISKGYDYIKCKRTNNGLEIKKPSTMCLIEDFLEAKHNKICPRIEFVYDEDEQ
jgi:hypothetical protein